MSKNFKFEASKVAKVAGEIREGKSDGENKTPLVPPSPSVMTDSEAQEEVSQGHEENTVVAAEQPTPVKTAKPKTKKSGDFNKVIEEAKVSKATNGIVVNVPLEDYMQLTLLKTINKKTLKELALQAIHEFVERNKVM